MIDVRHQPPDAFGGAPRGRGRCSEGGWAMPASVVSPIAAPGGKGRRKVCPGRGGVRRGNAPGFGRPFLGDTEMLSASSTTGRCARKEVPRNGLGMGASRERARHRGVLSDRSKGSGEHRDAETARAPHNSAEPRDAGGPDVFVITARREVLRRPASPHRSGCILGPCPRRIFPRGDDDAHHRRPRSGRPSRCRSRVKACPRTANGFERGSLLTRCFPHSR